MDRDVAIRLVEGLNNLKSNLTAWATNTTPEPPTPSNAQNVSSVLMSTSPEEITDPEPVNEITTRKRTTSK